MEVCDGRDNHYDGDGHGGPTAASVSTCGDLPEQVADASDCDDAQPNAFPSNPEVARRPLCSDLWSRPGLPAPMRPLAIEPRRAELERLGFDIIHADDTSLLALRQRWHLDWMTKTAILIWVQRLGHLDADRLEADHALLRKHFTEHDPSPAWPVGLQRTRLLVPVFLADEATEDARTKASATPAREFAAVLFPVVVTPEGSSWHLKTPTLGAVLYPLLRWFAERLATPHDDISLEPRSNIGKALAVLNAALLSASVIALVLLAGLLVLMAVGLIGVKLAALLP